MKTRAAAFVMSLLYWPSSRWLRFAVMALLLALTTPRSRGDDWPQWLGPQRDGVWHETGILDKFPAGGPPVRWRAPIGSGYSGPAVYRGHVYVMDRVNSTNALETEQVLCLNEANGSVVWHQEYPCHYTLSYPAGPRVTPTCDGERVYTLGAVGMLACWDRQSGQKVWSRDFTQEFKAKVPMWGFAGHPLVDGQNLICLVGGPNACVVAFDKATGKESWRALDAKEPGYSPPVIYEAGGRRQLIVWHPEAVNSLDPDTGRIYWSHPFASKSGLTITTPRKSGDYLFVTCFYNGSLLLRLDRNLPAATEVWRGRSDSEIKTDGLHSIIPTPFLENGYIYGVCSYGQLRCLKLETGERLWETFAPITGKSTRWGNAFLIKQGDRFFLWNEKGDLIIARLTPQAYEEVSRAHLLEPVNRDAGRGVVWSHPAFANRCFYGRNDQEIICVSLASSAAGQ